MKELRTLFFTLIILTITTNCFGQNIKVDSSENILWTEIENVLEKKSLEDLLKFKKTKCITKNKFSQDEKKNLIDNFNHSLISIKIEYRIDESTTSFYGYDISLINLDNEIIYYKILDEKTTKKSNFKEPKKLTELQISYSKFYFDTLKIEDLETFGKHTYGTSCGYNGETLNERTEMEKHLAKKNISFFNSWISNPSLELKAYSYEAFRRLEKKGIILTRKHYKLLEYLENNNSYVNTCEGCIGERITMKELTKKLIKK